MLEMLESELTIVMVAKYMRCNFSSEQHVLAIARQRMFNTAHVGHLMREIPADYKDQAKQ